MHALAVPAVLAAALAVLSGCTSCQPLLDVRHCIEDCVTGPDPVQVVWTEADTEAWPDVERLMDGLPVGEHDHETWSPEEARAFWDHYGVEGEEKELVVFRDDEMYRVRVLDCG